MARSINREMVAPLALAVLAVLAISVSAATLTTAEPGGDNQITTPVDRVMTNQSYGERPELNGSVRQGGGDAGTEIEFTTCIDFLTTTLGMLLVLGGFAAVTYVIYRRYDTSTAMLGGYALAPPTLFVYVAATQCIGGGDRKTGDGGSSSAGLLEKGDGPLDAVSPEPWMIGLLFGAVLVAAVVMLVTTSGDEIIEPPKDEDDEPEMSDFARAAGRAAERIEKHNADVDNAVYRAWREMTGLLDVPSPKTSTPGEFADAAIDFGLAEDDVTELTWLFNEVRYGGRDPAEREDRAVEILRHIESEYGGVDADATDEAGDDSR